MTAFYLLNSDDKEVVMDGKKYHTSINKKFICDGRGCNKKDLLYRSEIAACGEKHFCLECVKVYCKENKIRITTDDLQKIGRAIRKKIPIEKKHHNPFHYRTLLKLESYLTNGRLMRGIKYRKLKQDLFPKTPYGTMWREKLVKYFDLVEDRSNGYTVLYSREGYEAFKKKESVNENVAIIK